MVANHLCLMFPFASDLTRQHAQLQRKLGTTLQVATPMVDRELRLNVWLDALAAMRELQWILVPQGVALSLSADVRQPFAYVVCYKKNVSTNL